MSTVPTLESYLNRITSEYRNQPKFVAYVTALVQPLLDSQALLRSLLDIYDIDTAVGVQLDAVGKWIGRSRYLEQPLNGIYFSFDSTGLGFDQGTWFGPFDAIDGLTTLDDTTYRALLYAKRVMNNWNGTIPQIAEAIAALLAGTSPGSNLIVVDNQDMSMTVGIAGQVPPAAIISLLQGNYVPITPSGVGPNYLITSVNGTALYGFDVENASISGMDVGAFAGVAGTGPGPVSGFALVSQTPTTATFSWLPPATGTGPYSYQLQDQVDGGIGGLWNQDGPPVSTTTVTVALLPGHNYAFQVYAINSAGPGAPSGAIDLSTGAATNVNVAATVQLPSLTLTASATAQGRLLAATASIPALTAVAVGTASGTSATGLSSLVFSAIGIVARPASGRASIPPLAAVGVAGQVGTDFAAAVVPVLQLVAVGLVTNPILAMATVYTPAVVARAVVTQRVGARVLGTIPSLVANANASIGAGQVIVINPVTGASQAVSFTVTGTMSGMPGVPSLSYIDDATLPTIAGVADTETQTTIALTWTPDTDPTPTSIPAAGVTRTQFTFSHPSVVAGVHTLLITNGSVSSTVTYTAAGTAESPDPTTAVFGQTINASPTPGIAGSGNILAINSSGQITNNGSIIPGGSAQVTKLYYTGHTAYQFGSGLWFGPITATGTGTGVSDPSVESPAATTVIPPTGSITASQTPGSAGIGNVVTIAADGKVAVNSVEISATSGVTKLYYTGSAPGSNGATAHSAYQFNGTSWFGPITATSGGIGVGDPTLLALSYMLGNGGGGNTGNTIVATEETWLGRPLDMRNDVSVIGGGGPNTWTSSNGKSMGVLCSFELLCDGYGGSSFNDLAAAAAGSYNSQYTAMAQHLAGLANPVPTVRIGWECNGNWFGWSPGGNRGGGGTNVNCTAANFIGAFRQASQMIRAQLPNTLIEWCCNWAFGDNQYGSGNPQDFWPGKYNAATNPGGCDVISMDWYESNIGSWATVQSSGTYNLDWLAGWSSTNSVPMCFSEVGVGMGGGENGGNNTNDDGTFMSSMISWMNAQGNNFAYCCLSAWSPTLDLSTINGVGIANAPNTKNVLNAAYSGTRFVRTIAGIYKGSAVPSE